MKKVFVGAALLGVLLLGNSCNAREELCRSRCDETRSNCYDKAIIPIVDKAICDNDHKKCTESCR